MEITVHVYGWTLMAPGQQESRTISNTINYPQRRDEKKLKKKHKSNIIIDYCITVQAVTRGL